MKVAIIGAGVAGLSAAYYLTKRASQMGSELEIHIYERKTHLGGNADTVVVDLGERMGASGPEGRYQRWADLGVNDANLATYTRLRALLEELDYLDEMKPLENSTSYTTHDGRVSLTDDDSLTHGVSDPRFSLRHADDGRLAPLIRVVHQTGLDLATTGDTPVTYTVGQFFGDCINTPRKMLADAATRLGVKLDWDDPGLQDRVGQVRDLIYYPRIAAMYFTDDTGPENLPLLSPFEYYATQEGGKTPDRRYFNHGSQAWLDRLAEHLQSESGGEVRVALYTGVEARIDVRAGSVAVTRGEDQAEEYDLCIPCTHADDTRELIHFGPGAEASEQTLRGILGQVRYTRSFSVCHTYAGIMPPNRNLWRTYNIPVRNEGNTFFPYRIHYVANRHQNDALNPDYNQAGLPQYFVSLVSDLNDIPHQDILDRVTDAKDLPLETLCALPRSTREQLRGNIDATGYKHLLGDIPEAYHRKAWTLFKHNVLDARCMDAQARMKDYNLNVAKDLAQGKTPDCPLLFGGGWTNKAGLHEQCLEQSESIAGWVLPG